MIRERESLPVFSLSSSSSPASLLLLFISSAFPSVLHRPPPLPSLFCTCSSFLSLLTLSSFPFFYFLPVSFFPPLFLLPAYFCSSSPPLIRSSSFLFPLYVSPLIFSLFLLTSFVLFLLFCSFLCCLSSSSVAHPFFISSSPLFFVLSLFFSSSPDFGLWTDVSECLFSFSVSFAVFVSLYSFFHFSCFSSFH